MCKSKEIGLNINDQNLTNLRLMDDISLLWEPEGY